MHDQGAEARAFRKNNRPYSPLVAASVALDDAAMSILSGCEQFGVEAVDNWLSTREPVMQDLPIRLNLERGMYFMSSWYRPLARRA
jgi:hypothetical protein